MELVTEKLNIKKVSISELIKNLDLYQSVYNLALPSYVNPDAMLKRDIDSCDRIYLAYDNQAKLCTFFMVGQQKLILNGNPLVSFYLGLGATSMATKNSGIIRQLYQAFIHDVQELEAKINQRIPLWHTTATPSVFHAFNQMFVENEPDGNGLYTEKGKSLVLAIRSEKGWNYQVNEHPFVVKNIAHNTLYSDSEVARIKQICIEKNFRLFDELGIDERKGDRLIRISFVPSA